MRSLRLTVFLGPFSILLTGDPRPLLRFNTNSPGLLGEDWSHGSSTTGASQTLARLWTPWRAC